MFLVFRILNTTLFESWELIGPYPSWWLFNGLLVILQVLHVIWSCLIMRIAYRSLTKGKVGLPLLSFILRNMGQFFLKKMHFSPRSLLCPFWYFKFLSPRVSRSNDTSAYLPVLCPDKVTLLGESIDVFTLPASLSLSPSFFSVSGCNWKVSAFACKFSVCCLPHLPACCPFTLPHDFPCHTLPEPSSMKLTTCPNNASHDGHQLVSSNTFIKSTSPDTFQKAVFKHSAFRIENLAKCQLL